MIRRFFFVQTLAIFFHSFICSQFQRAEDGRRNIISWLIDIKDYIHTTWLSNLNYISSRASVSEVRRGISEKILVMSPCGDIIFLNVNNEKLYSFGDLTHSIRQFNIWIWLNYFSPSLALSSQPSLLVYFYSCSIFS